jgi:pilus assembly protein CpaB
MAVGRSVGGRLRGGRIYILGGTILALIAFIAAAGIASLPLLTQSTNGTTVVVAKNSISARTKIQSGDLQLKVVTPIPPESFTSIDAVTGKGARVDIPAGSAVTANLIASGPDLLSTTDVTYLPIPQGYVAVTIPTSELVGVAGYVQVGDRIIVLASINTAAFGAAPAAVVIRTVFRDLDIIRVGPVSAQSNGLSVPSSLTVMMTPCDSEYLFWLLNNADMKYELESFRDYATLPSQANADCPSLTSTKGVGPKEVDAKWNFSAG